MPENQNTNHVSCPNMGHVLFAKFQSLQNTKKTCSYLNLDSPWEGSIGRTCAIPDPWSPAVAGGYVGYPLDATLSI